MSSPAADPADLALAIELAEDAGASTLAWFQSATLAVEHKGDGSPVTAADLAAEAPSGSDLPRRIPVTGSSARRTTTSKAAPGGGGSSTRSTARKPS